MKYLVVSSSLSPKSRSRAMAQLVFGDLEGSGEQVEWLDLMDHPLPFCDGGAAFGDPRLEPVAGMVKQADGILLVGPIYNYDFSAAAKNLVELTGADCWSGKVVGFLAAAGGGASYLSVLSLANSLMVDFRCVIIPRFVYADGGAFGKDGKLEDHGVRERIGGVARDLVGFTEGLQKALARERGRD
jgi:FMN reductase